MQQLYLSWFKTKQQSNWENQQGDAWSKSQVTQWIGIQKYHNLILISTTQMKKKI